VLNTFLKTLELIRRPKTWRWYSSGTLRPANVMVAIERYVQSPLKILQQLLTIYSYEGRKIEYTERINKDVHS